MHTHKIRRSIPRPAQTATIMTITSRSWYSVLLITIDSKIKISKNIEILRMTLIFVSEKKISNIQMLHFV